MPGLCLAGVAYRQTNLIFRHAGTRVLADEAQSALSEGLLGRARAKAGVLKSGAAGPHLGGAPVKLSFPSDSWSAWAIHCHAAWRQSSLLDEMVLYWYH